MKRILSMMKPSRRGRARDVIAGVRYLPRLDSQSDAEYAAYKERAPCKRAPERCCILQGRPGRIICSAITFFSSCFAHAHCNLASPTVALRPA